LDEKDPKVMITLHKFGPHFGLPDPSPFVTKAELLLKLAGLSYEVKLSDLRKAPKGKLPFIRDDGELIADSTFIRLHIERKCGFDFDEGLSAEQKGIAWAAEKMCENELYWASVHNRWLDDANFNRGPATFFDAAPAPIRPLVKIMVRRGIRKALYAQGIGRHSNEEIAELARRDIAALAAILGDKPFFFGATPCGADATLAAFVASSLCKTFTSSLRDATETHPNLVAYSQRMMTRYFPDFA
jgi:glutathione S-transferase